MNHSEDDLTPEDNGGRRLGIDRRVFCYDSHIPERRRGNDQRSGHDRRTGDERRRLIIVIRQPNRQKGPERRSGRDRRTAFG